MKLLFVCSRNRKRSPTAEAVFSIREGIEALSAGTSIDAENPISIDLIEWADIIFAMENVHRKCLNQKFGSALRSKRVVVLGIPDKYSYMDSDLVDVLQTKVLRYLPSLD